jgi:acetoacetate decarboxylase
VTDTPASPPGEIVGIPKLVIRYRTDADCISALLPPGMTPWGEPIVQIGIYCVPVHGEPEYGVSTKVPATWNGVDGQYSLGIGIDQESAIFISRETNGQPKFPCSIRYFRLGDTVHASCTHQGHTFLSYRGTITGSAEIDDVETHDDEWWIKVSRAAGGADGAYDFPPHVVRVHTSGVPVRIDTLDGEFELRPSAWDPYTELLPQRSEAEAELVTMRHTGRSIALDEPLDPEAFWPHADTIGGSRWPGLRGGPRG